MSSPTRVQRYVSPVMTRLFALVYRDRYRLASEVKQIAGGLNERQQAFLRRILVKHGIIQSQFRRSPLSSLDHSHFAKTITLKTMVAAAHDYFLMTGRGELLEALSRLAGINLGVSASTDQGRGEKIWTALRKIAPKLVRPLVESEASGQQKLIDQAFELATTYSVAVPVEALYRVRKSADIGGNIQTIIASLFMNTPLAVLEDQLLPKCEGKLSELMPSVVTIIRDYQRLRDSFRFEIGQLMADEEYLYKKMSELIHGAGTPEPLLLFFLNKLLDARKANKPGENIFDEIRIIYAPLAARTGLIYLADDFRDQHFRLSNPGKYSDVVMEVWQRIKMDYESAKEYLASFCADLFTELRQVLGQIASIFTIVFRVKSPFGILNKVEVRKKVGYQEINDILALKVIVNSEAELRRVDAALGKISSIRIDHKSRKEVIGEAEEGWQGIKMIVYDKTGLPIEIQLVTQEMDLENARGKASHWRYDQEKELGTIVQRFPKLEPAAVMTANYSENFYQLKNHWTLQPEEAATT